MQRDNNMLKNKDLMSYISLSLVLSYVLLKNIILVIIGTLIASYIINKNGGRELVKTDQQRNDNYDLNNEKILEEEKQSKISLVEAVEQLGFIPSIDKNKNAA
tara:strand:- start:14 stop:322 length:309 start_codon:yes stop_codon:yes gene_type:complete